MIHHSLRALAATSALVAALHATPVFEPLQGFALPPLHSQGTLLRAADGNFYGTSALGGAYGQGTVFRLTPAGALTVLHSFESGGPQDGLILGPDGALYGTCPAGGNLGDGCVFRITTSGDLSILADFSQYNFKGYAPQAALLLGADGAFYGTTTRGGLHGSGTAFKLTTGGTLTAFHHFDLLENDQPGCALVQDANGDFYGSTTGDLTYAPGDEHRGTLFRLTAAGVRTTLHTFQPIGSGPTDATLIRGQDGNFHGTASNTGTAGKGTLFQLTPAGTLTTRYEFDGLHGQEPAAPLLRTADGTLYGTTAYDSTYLSGTAFKLAADGTLATLRYFGTAAAPLGVRPLAGLALGTDGALYGTTSVNQQGSEGGGAFKISTANARYTLLSTFRSLSPAQPLGSLREAADGNFYGISRSGGTHDDGTIFRITPGHAIAPTYHFDGSTYAARPTSLVIGRDRNLYGTTSYDPLQTAGTFFRCTPGGVLTRLSTFDPATSSRPLSLIQGSDGNFYGTAERGSAAGKASLFKLTPRGVRTVLTDLDSATGNFPVGDLLRTSTGTLLGVSGAGGTQGRGTVFTLPSGGTATPLLSFDSGPVTADAPAAGLVPGPDGWYYGTTQFGGAYGNGTVYKVNATGTYQLVASFPVNYGSNPNSKLQPGPDGSLYGTTAGTSIYNLGTVFRVTPAGQITLLASFDGDNGAQPTGDLLLASDGHLYGTTLEGGTTAEGRPAGGGEYYRIRLGALTTPQAADAITARGATLHGTVQTGGLATNVAFQYTTDPTFRRSTTVQLGTLAPSANPTSVQTTLTRLAPGRTYWFRLLTRNAENPIDQPGDALSFTTPRS
ncbi:choice-of-anchor tandem repeat GloVer-containing protein [Luteolibacter sp. LG18]|uniref:choice-of-anchor tandem repeat GloVer-containing protein n=1 Tax=Luteolibacter sp. LG18 TaxID=2819286 RepID=UPI002B2FAFCC|nr:hypothetical protein llg_26880 [Luteolibacter sp. LG18]